jgi:O-antigen ligase
MDFVALIIFLALYYVRPQEWFADFNAIRPVQLLSIAAVCAMVQSHKLNPRDLVRTPLDWLILCYFVWTLLAGGDPMHALVGIQASILFYFVAVRSLDSVHRQKIFLGWWCAFILFVAVAALASLYGFDPLSSADKTQGVMKGRLILNLSVFNNPNALAHCVVPAIPLLYYLLCWRRTFMKVGLLLLAIPLYCIYLTESKGAFICGFVTVLATLTFGRSRVWQILILLFAVCFGYGALYTLPRMNELQHSKTDAAIQGRVAALQFGLQCMQTHFFGIGLANFQDYFFKYGPMEKIQTTRELPARFVPASAGSPAHEQDVQRKRVNTWRHYVKATHNAYNQNGAELGYFGLFLFVGILYCCVRTLLLVKSETDDEERIRRALFATVVAYATSSWMVDFTYRPPFFMFVASISAFQRYLLDKNKPVEIAEIASVRPWLRRLLPAGAPGLALPGMAAAVQALPAGFVSPVAVTATRALPSPAHIPSSASALPIRPAPVWRSGPPALRESRETIEATLRKRFTWTRLGIWDLIAMVLLTCATVAYWKHLIGTM